MQFVTVREPREGEFHYRVSGGRSHWGPFRYLVTPNAAVERVYVTAVEAVGARDFDAVLRFISNVSEGVQDAIEHAANAWAKRLCCIRIEVTDMKSHPTATSADWMFLQGAAFVRELLGYAVPIPPLQSEWLTPDVVSLARGIGTGAALDGIPALYDALLEAGCDDPLVMEHLRTCADHSPSCWVVEMILDQAAARG